MNYICIRTLPGGEIEVTQYVAGKRVRSEKVLSADAAVGLATGWMDERER